MLLRCHNDRIVRPVSFCFRTWPCLVMPSELLPIWIETSARTRVTRTAFTCFIPRGGSRKWQMLFCTNFDTIAVNRLSLSLALFFFLAPVSMLMWYLFMVFVAAPSWLGGNKKRRTSSNLARTVGLRYFRLNEFRSFFFFKHLSVYYSWTFAHLSPVATEYIARRAIDWTRSWQDQKWSTFNQHLNTLSSKHMVKIENIFGLWHNPSSVSTWNQGFQYQNNAENWNVSILRPNGFYVFVVLSCCLFLRLKLVFYNLDPILLI